VLFRSHRDLEKLTLSRDVLHAKAGIEGEYARLVYDGLWFSPLRTALQAFVDNTQGRVSGTARVKLFKGGLMVIGRTSHHSLYSQKLVSYSNSVFDQNAARGFIELFSMPLRVSARQRMRAAAEPDPAPAAAAGDKTGAEAEA
jgi:argininosuccinate synthase